MNCRKATQLFSEHIEGLLDPERSERLRAHLDRCADCAELIEIMELNIVQLNAVADPAMPAGLEQRLAFIPQCELAAASAAGQQTGEGQRSSGGHWLFSNAAAAVILALFITANLTWFNPDFQGSIHVCRRLLNDKSARALEMASNWEAGLNDLKQKVESRIDEVRNADGRAGKGADETEENISEVLVTGIIRALGLIGA
jgi:hypothetical protein